MKKKERNRLKQMANSKEWLNENEKVKNDFLNHFLTHSGKTLRAKDKAYICKTLLK